jgi:hypothetical protein
VDLTDAPDADALRTFVASAGNDPRLIDAWRRDLGDAWTDAALASARLQPKARTKFGDGLWWCSERSLAQATPRRVAEVKASWMNAATVWDLCCGIGGDSVAIAERLAAAGGRLVAIDRDPMMAAMVKANLTINCRAAEPIWEVRCDDVQNIRPPRDAIVHIDPDRREAGRRTTRPQDYAPPWDAVERLIDGCSGALIKLAPAARLEDRTTGHRLWISLGGSVREQSLLVGSVIEQASASLNVPLRETDRGAILIDSDGSTHCFSDQANRDVDCITEPQAFMIDPDAAIRAAGLTEAFALRHGCSALGRAAGFLTGASLVAAPWAVCERVVWCGSADDRKLRKTLRSMDAFPWRVKARGVDHNPNELERRYRRSGQRPLTLWIGKTAKRYYAVLTEAV